VRSCSLILFDSSNYKNRREKKKHSIILIHHHVTRIVNIFNNLYYECKHLIFWLFQLLSNVGSAWYNYLPLGLYSVFMLTHLSEARNKKTGFGQVKIMKEFACKTIWEKVGKCPETSAYLNLNIFCDQGPLYWYRVVSPRILFTPWVASPLFPFALGRFTLIY
jgi:hypothetical protein